MFTNNPFASVTDFLPPLAMQVYVVLMILAVAMGTFFDAYHKGSAKFFALRREKSKAAAQRPLSGMETASIAARTIAEAAISGEFCKWRRRTSHLLMLYGFLLYAITTIVMVFAYPTAAHTPIILPALWNMGALMVLIGGSWFFFFLRVNVAYDGASPFHLGRADLFIGALLASAAFALIWHFVQSAYESRTASLIFFGLYIFCTTLLFVSVPWSKFAHMFYKPAVAFQRRVEEANGSSDLPSPAAESHIARS
ncbi:MAG: adenylyl-sulfate reductase [Burkholderiales bacterium]|nr:adenylyl-sulfate reductase [Burkholderiales bacterium]